MIIKIPLESLDIPPSNSSDDKVDQKLVHNCEDQLENLVDTYYKDQYLLAVGWKI